jgi:CDP-diacylglycerol--glycerol-3-phosphate 3-phosphatidyltransferase
MVVMLLPAFADFSDVTDMILTVVGAFLFIAASITDMLDGKIARRDGLVTDFGKFLDPLADKFMVIGALLCIFFNSSMSGNKVMSTVFFFSLVVVFFRELAVTSIRLVASSSSGVVIAANMLGKIKTVTQIVAICSALLEPVLIRIIGMLIGEGSIPEVVLNYPPLTLVSTVVMMYFTVHSGINYIVGAWKYLDPEK